jgi:DNA invertase Pin-like site-specific DNA recombinase
MASRVASASDPPASAERSDPAWPECATLLETGNYDAFAVYNLSRLARDIVVMEQFLKEYVVATNTTFFSATEDIDLSTSQGWLYVRLMTAVSTSQREGMIERNRDAAAARVEQGYALGDAATAGNPSPRRIWPPASAVAWCPVPNRASG